MPHLIASNSPHFSLHIGHPLQSICPHSPVPQTFFREHLLLLVQLFSWLKGFLGLTFLCSRTSFDIVVGSFIRYLAISLKGILKSSDFSIYIRSSWVRCLWFPFICLDMLSSFLMQAGIPAYSKPLAVKLNSGGIWWKTNFHLDLPYVEVSISINN